MTESEYKERINTIDILKTSSDSLKKEIESKSGDIFKFIKSYLDTVYNEEEVVRKYIDILSEFSFSNKLTSPSDLFPGVRVISQEINPEDLKQKTDTMKDCLAKFTSESKKIEILENNAIRNLKQCLGLLSEYILKHDQISSLETELLNDMDSVYDIRTVN